MLHDMLWPILLAVVPITRAMEKLIGLAIGEVTDARGGESLATGITSRTTKVAGLFLKIG